MSSGLQNNQNQKIILVDENDAQIGFEDKLKAHQNGAKLHRAISIFVFNDQGETMLQQRSLSKYHTPGKWSNTCCSHPMMNENVMAAAHRRLKEEMGFDCEMKEAFSLIYKADVGNGLTEHEYDHVILGHYNGEPKLNKEEALDYRWVSIDELRKEIRKVPNTFTPWLEMMLEKVVQHYKIN